MAMEVVHVIGTNHDEEIMAVAYNRMRKEIYSAAQGDKDIKVWDFKTGQLIRNQSGHKGWVSSLVYATTVKMLFSGGIDGYIIVWTDRGVELQTVMLNGPVFALAWNSKQRILASGGLGTVNIFKVDTSDVQKLNQARRAAQLSASGTKQKSGKPDLEKPKEEIGSIIKKVGGTLKGPDTSHNDAVKALVATDTGKLVTGGFDRCLCLYDCEKPRESYRKIKNCHTAAISSMVLDTDNNWVVTGSFDGSFRVWSMEGRCLDRFEGVADGQTIVAYVPLTKMYWITGRNNKLVAYDPRAPANVSDYVQDSNQLKQFSVNLMFVPPKTDLVMAATREKQIVVWRYNRSGAYRVFRNGDEWVEHVLIIPIGTGAGYQRIFTCGTNGRLLHWKLDAEQNCDVYHAEDDTISHGSTILCATFDPQMECIVTGAEDACIRVHYLDGHVPMDGDTPLPTFFDTHTNRITGLAILEDNVLASVSYDKSLRTWNLFQMKPLQTIENAHHTPVQALDYCKEHKFLATCGMEHQVKIWDASNPQILTLKIVLNHRLHSDVAQDVIEVQDSGARAPDNRSQMKWLTQSDVGLGEDSLDIVQEAINNAQNDVPEVTQVRWVSFRDCWITAADDDMMRIWSRGGDLLHSFVYNGGSVQCLFVDEINQLILAATLDKSVAVYTLEDPVPIARYRGHDDIVRSIGYLSEKGLYVTGGWDGTIRLWLRPKQCGNEETAGGLNEGQDAQHQHQLSTRVSMGHFNDDDEDEMGLPFVSMFEKSHPLQQPEILSVDYGQLWKSLALMEEYERQTTSKWYPGGETHGSLPAGTTPSAIDHRLEEMNKKMLKEIKGQTKTTDNQKAVRRKRVGSMGKHSMRRHSMHPRKNDG
ncbi:hypothetical protein BSKO_05387 [Bryopsis sp. KO-2023]|nr:hypothetical protein BSKO_05387 [Bryopsis sp. KO-2023]